MRAANRAALSGLRRSIERLERRAAAQAMDAQPAEISASMTAMIEAVNNALGIIQRDNLVQTGGAMLKYVGAVDYALRAFLAKRSNADMKGAVASQLGADAPIAAYETTAMDAAINPVLLAKLERQFGKKIAIPASPDVAPDSPVSTRSEIDKYLDPVEPQSVRDYLGHIEYDQSEARERYAEFARKNLRSLGGRELL
jgi:hypothetical protein